MRQFHVTFYYLASGMEGRADVQDYGIVYANNETEAKRKAAEGRHPDMSPQDINWTMGCLTAKEIR
jgi:hypothetical protein